MFLTPRIDFCFEQSADKKELLLTATMACKREAGASSSDLRELMSRVLPTTHEGKCMRKCFLTKFGVVSQKSRSDNKELMHSIRNDNIFLDPKILD